MEFEDLFRDLPTFKTNRLILIKITFSDLDDIYEFSSDSEVAQRMTWEVNKSIDDTLNKFIKVVIEEYEKG